MLVAAKGQDAKQGRALGLFDPQAAYDELDRVSFKNCEWIAMRDQPGELPGDGWMLAAKGKPGPIGPKGERGLPGKDGVGFKGARLDEWTLVLDLSDGRTARIDMRSLFERYDSEVRA